MASELECAFGAAKSTLPGEEAAAPSREAELWQRLQHDPKDYAAREELVELHLPIVNGELKRISYHLPAHVDRQELYAEGLTGLLSAVTHYQTGMGVVFEAYARKRVWGSMMDRVRSICGVPRSARVAARRVTAAVQKFMAANDRQPDEAELARELNVSIEDLHELERQAGLAQTLSLDHAVASDGEGEVALADCIPAAGSERANALDLLTDAETRELVAAGLKALPDRERAVLVLYYHENLMLKEIAEAMDVSESRISQLHNRAILRIRAFVERTEAGHDHKRLEDRPAAAAHGTDAESGHDAD